MVTRGLQVVTANKKSQALVRSNSSGHSHAQVVTCAFGFKWLHKQKVIAFVRLDSGEHRRDELVTQHTSLCIQSYGHKAGWR